MVQWFVDRLWERRYGEAITLASNMLAKSVAPRQELAAARAVAAETTEKPSVEAQKHIEEIEQKLVAAQVAPAAAQQDTKDCFSVDFSKRLSKMGLQISNPTPTAASVFQLLGKNGDDRLTKEEVISGAERLNMTPEEAAKLFDELDVDGSGELTLDEFFRFTAKFAERFDPIEEAITAFVFEWQAYFGQKMSVAMKSLMADEAQAPSEV